MFVIKDSQIAAFQEKELGKFVQKSVIFLQSNFENWCSEKNQQDLEKFIVQTIKYGKESNIRKQQCIQKLMFLQIEYKFSFPIKGEEEKILSEAKKPEDVRLTKLHKYLDQKR